MTQAQLYQKADSILALSGDLGDHESVLARVKALAGRLDTLGLDSHRRAVIAEACADLMAPEAAEVERPLFRLRPHVVAEISRLGDEYLPRYLFYRYRYEIYPATRQLDKFPPCVQIEPTSMCNYRCVFCYQIDRNLTQGRHGHMGMMSVDLFKRVVDQIEGEVEAVTLASRGEPLMAKGIKDMLAYCEGKFLGLKINTNASKLTEELSHAVLSAEPSMVVFSADAADADLYARLRVNGQLDQVLENIRRFQRIRAEHYPKARTITRVSGVRAGDDGQKFSDIEAFWKEHVDQVAFVDNVQWIDPYKNPGNDITAPCSDLWRRMFVWWDGRTNPCDVDYLSTLSPGKLGEGGVSGIWAGEGYSRLRAQHETPGGRARIKPCSGCTLV